MSILVDDAIVEHHDNQDYLVVQNVKRVATPINVERVAVTSPRGSLRPGRGSKYRKTSERKLRGPGEIFVVETRGNN